ncbi:hypothetical protein [Streptomyces sp. SID12488]|uniref:hypothetical protein n=1 Tax=Streptomyces sp. SID12488 TaxID=2706040 RepID=UPI0013DC1D1F|nr:hypothetical protein [Streptomyces sp. SID12488]NEA68999.1 hypothetical protein [Streptomyces sp. SID12488]
MTAADLGAGPAVGPRRPTGAVVAPGPATPADLARHIDEVSARLARLAGPLDAEAALDDTRDHARALGLPPGDLAGPLSRGLAQTGSLGPDESAEYRRNLQALFDATGVADPASPTPQELYAAFHRMGREVALRLAQALPVDAGRTVLFLGTDAEFLKPSYDLLAGGSGASEVFYLSRLSLLSDAERAVLSRTSRRVFGPQEVTARSAAGRQRAWMDNGLVASELARMVTAAREEADRRPGGPLFEELFAAAFAEEAAHGTDQARRLAEGLLTLHGTPLPETDAVLREGIGSGLFAEVCRTLGRRLPVTRPDGGARPLTLVDIGANGTQPALLMGAAHVVHDRPDVHVRLFTPHPARWGRPGVRFRTAPATSLFALGVETVKSFATDYGSVAAGAPHTVKAVDPDQLLLAHLKHLAFHRAAWETRGYAP